MERPTLTGGLPNVFAVHSDSQGGRIASPALINQQPRPNQGTFPVILVHQLAILP